MLINELWNSNNEKEWKKALEGYWNVKTAKRQIENYFKYNHADEVRNMTGEDFYAFLHDKYFLWKYTDCRFFDQILGYLEGYNDDFSELLIIKNNMFIYYDRGQYELLFDYVTRIKGLGVAGASGLLAVLFPEQFGTVDRFVLTSLNEIDSINIKQRINNINGKGISVKGGLILENIMREKAQELNIKFKTNEWTPRKIDMILWSKR